jgi:hypothetical protein
MEIKKVRVHTCNQKQEGYIERKCRCRKFVTPEEAVELIDDGIAAYVILAYRTIEIKEICPICVNTASLKRSCSFCNTIGEISKKKIHIDYGEDIYMRPVLKTPRTATIEEEHIEYAYIKRDRDAIKRIDLYHGLNQAALVELGASIINSITGEIVFQGTIEPEDNLKKGTGRKYDYGRSI